VKAFSSRIPQGGWPWRLTLAAAGKTRIGAVGRVLQAMAEPKQSSPGSTPARSKPCCSISYATHMRPCDAGLQGGAYSLFYSPARPLPGRPERGRASEPRTQSLRVGPRRLGCPAQRSHRTSCFSSSRGQRATTSKQKPALYYYIPHDEPPQSRGYSMEEKTAVRAILNSIWLTRKQEQSLTHFAWWFFQPDSGSLLGSLLRGRGGSE
jgi:hypothetical protein